MLDFHPTIFSDNRFPTSSYVQFRLPYEPDTVERRLRESYENVWLLVESRLSAMAVIFPTGSKE